MADEPEKTESSTDQPVTTPAGKVKGKAKVELKVELDLDDLEVFDLRGEGIKTVTVVSN